MDLYLIRHGLAKDAKQDAERTLTDQGMKETEAIAHRLGRWSVKVDAVWHSGKKRALQTAETLRKSINPQPELSQTEGMKPMDDPKVIKEKIEAVGKNIMIVGHFPHLAKLASVLLCGDENRNVVEIRNSAVLCLSNNSGRWVARWYVLP